MHNDAVKTRNYVTCSNVIAYITAFIIIIIVGRENLNNFPNILFLVISALASWVVILGLNKLYDVENSLRSVSTFYTQILRRRKRQRSLESEEIKETEAFLQTHQNDNLALALVGIVESHEMGSDKMLDAPDQAHDISTDDALEEIGPWLRVAIEHAPAIFAALGIIFTFYGLISAIDTIDLKGSSEKLFTSLQGLLAGVGVAFFSSIGGVSLSFLTLVLTRHRLSAISNLTADIRRSAGNVEHNHAPQVVLSRIEQQSVMQYQLMRELVDLTKEQESKIGAMASDIATKLSDALPDAFAHAINANLADPLENLAENMEGFASNILQAHGTVLDDMTSNFIDQFTSRLSERFDQLEKVLSETAQWHETTRDLYDQTWKNLSSHVTAHHQQLELETKHFTEQKQFEEKREAHTQEALANSQNSLDLLREHIDQTQSIVTNTGQISDSIAETAQNLQSATTHLQEFDSKISEAVTTSSDRTIAHLDAINDMFVVLEQLLSATPGHYAKMFGELREDIDKAMQQSFKSFDQGSSEVVDRLGGTYIQIQQSLGSVTHALDAMNQSVGTINQSTATMSKSAGSLSQSFEGVDKRILRLLQEIQAAQPQQNNPSRATQTGR